MEPWYTIHKRVGETPLEALERLRSEKHIPKHVPLAYAGRLDPMASGLLLVLVGDECKAQERYHALDKEYVFEVLLGVGSDTHDVLGIVTDDTRIPDLTRLPGILRSFTDTITLPYPHFSSRTVEGKPLHTWTLEGKLDTISIPTKTSRVYRLTHVATRACSGQSVAKEALARINTIPPVTDPRKTLGNDFRRSTIRPLWTDWGERHTAEMYTILTLSCIASSGTYMRSLAYEIGRALGTSALAYSINRTRMGTYLPILGGFGWFIHTY